MKKILLIGAVCASLASTQLLAGGKCGGASQPSSKCGAGKCGGAMNSPMKGKKMSFAQKKEKIQNRLFNIQKCVNNAHDIKDLRQCKKKLHKVIEKCKSSQNKGGHPKVTNGLTKVN